MSVTPEVPAIRWALTTNLEQLLPCDLLLVWQGIPRNQLGQKALEVAQFFRDRGLATAIRSKPDAKTVVVVLPDWAVPGMIQPAFCEFALDREITVMYLPAPPPSTGR